MASAHIEPQAFSVSLQLFSHSILKHTETG